MYIIQTRLIPHYRVLQVITCHIQEAVTEGAKFCLFIEFFRREVSWENDDAEELLVIYKGDFTDS